MKSTLTLPNGSSKYGAQMGRQNEIPSDYSGEKLRLTRLPFVDQCYDRWGAYWGSPANVWCAWGSTKSGNEIRVFARGDSREAARAKVSIQFTGVPQPRFFA